jgi:hypothetical protein
MAAQIIAKQMTMIILQTILKALGGGALVAAGHHPPYLADASGVGRLV